MSDLNSIPPILNHTPELPDHTGQADKICWNGRERRQSMVSLAEEVTKRLDRQDDLLLQFHDELVVHLAQTKETQKLVNELLELYKGSKFLVAVFKFFVPVVAAIAAGILWVKEHLK